MKIERPSKDILINLHNDGNSYRDIGILFNVSRGVVCYWFKCYNISIKQIGRRNTSELESYLFDLFRTMDKYVNISVNGMIKCEICSEYFYQINKSHLKFHSITVKEYKERYPHAKLITDSTRNILRDNFINNNPAKTTQVRKINSDWHLEHFKDKENHPMYGKHHTDTTKLKISISNTGKSHTDEAKLKMSHFQKGRKKSENHKNKIGDGNRGKICTDNTKLKMSKNHADVSGENNPFYGEKHTEITISKMKGHRDSISGDKNPNWNGGLSFGKYCYLFNKKFKEKIRLIYNQRCFLCNKSEKDNKEKLSVHHVNYDKDCLCGIQCEFVPLCRKCHAKINFNRKYWEDLMMNYLYPNRYFMVEI